ncbi:MAG: glycosyltransferase [Acidobacteriota bacterium]
MSELFAAYSRAVLSFSMEAEQGGYATASAHFDANGPLARRIVRAGHCVLLGVGRGEYARELAARLAPDTGFTVCETDGEQARAFGQGLPLLADASPVALAFTIVSAGLTRPNAVCVLNPEVADQAALARLKTVQRLHEAYAPLALSAPAASPGPRLTVAAILHPDEPGLPQFFSSLPDTAFEAVVVWDAPSPPQSPPPCPIPVRHLAHPLQNDFAAQRNRMLAACRGDWVLYLDGDERLDPALPALLPALTAQGHCAAFAFPRLGIGPSGVKIGWGLWPDLQLRLFRPGPDVRFVRPVHERLEGLAGPTGLVCGGFIRHLSDMLKDREALARKHALFDAAGGFSGLHRQNREYPVLPEAFFAALTPRPHVGAWPETVRFQPL